MRHTVQRGRGVLEKKATGGISVVLLTHCISVEKSTPSVLITQKVLWKFTLHLSFNSTTPNHQNINLTTGCGRIRF
jgi:hypothetical protein